MDQRPLNLHKLKQIEQQLIKYSNESVQATNYLNSEYNKRIQQRAINEQQINEHINNMKQRERELDKEWVRIIKEKDAILARMDVTLNRQQQRVAKVAQKATEIPNLIQHRENLQKQRILMQTVSRHLQIIEAQQAALQG